MVQALTILGILSAWLFLSAGLYLSYRFVAEVYHRFPEARLLQASHQTLKAWVIVYLAILLVSVTVGGLPTAVRQWLSLLLVALLNAQAVFTLYLYRRWRNPRKRIDRAMIAPLSFLVAVVIIFVFLGLHYLTGGD